MRIPYDIIRDGLSSINQAAENLASAQRQVSSGRRLNRAGDDPLGSQLAIGERAGLAAVDAYSRSTTGATSRLSAADSTLSSFGDKLSAALSNALGARGSSSTPASRAAASAEIRSLREALLSDINSTFDGDYLFSGTGAKTPAYANVGGVWTYQGTSGVTQVEVGKGRFVSVSFDGRAVAQGADATDVFTVLDQLAAAIDAGDDAGMGAGASAVERALDRTLRAQGKLGADERNLDDAALRLSTLKTAGEARRSSIEDANMADAITRLSTADTAYRAALASVSSAERISLLDYLR
jgi:flagellar hook-associated protein 3 FlgL